MFDKLADTIETGMKVREVGLSRTDMGGIRPRAGQHNWRYAVVTNGDKKFLRLGDGSRIFNFQLPGSAEEGAEEYPLERHSDLRDPDMESGGEVQSKGLFQVHRSEPSLIRGTMQDGRRGMSFDIAEQDGRWSLRPRQPKPRGAAAAMQFADRLGKTAAEEQAGSGDEGKWNEFYDSFGKENTDDFLAAFGLGPKYVPKEPTKYNCPKCHQKERSWREAHADTGMDEMELCCRNCGYSSDKEENEKVAHHGFGIKPPGSISDPNFASAMAAAAANPALQTVSNVSPHPAAPDGMLHSPTWGTPMAPPASVPRPPVPALPAAAAVPTPTPQLNPPQVPGLSSPPHVDPMPPAGLATQIAGMAPALPAPGVPPPTPTPMGAPAPAPGFTKDQLDAFHRNTGTAFNPHSRMDAMNMSRMVGGQSTMNYRQWAGRKVAALKPKGKKTRVETFEDECCPHCEYVFPEKCFPRIANREDHLERDAPPIYECPKCDKKFTEDEMSDEKIKEYSGWTFGEPDYFSKKRDRRRQWIADHPDWDQEDGEKTAGLRSDKLKRLRERRGECPGCGQPNKPPHGPCGCKTAAITALKWARYSPGAAERVGLNELIESAGNKAHPEPTLPQRRAGNYRMGHFWLQGLDVTIESAAGSERKGKSDAGKEWSVTMRHPYGYVRSFYYRGKRNWVRSMADEDHIDVFVGEHPDSQVVFVVDQLVGGKFDEHKVMVGFTNEADAKQAYLDNYSAGWTGFDGITSLTMDQFKRWMLKGDTSKRLAGAYVKDFLKSAFAYTTGKYASDYPRFDAATYPLHGDNKGLALGMGALGGAAIGAGIGGLRKFKRWITGEPDDDVSVGRHALMGGLTGLGVSGAWQLMGKNPYTEMGTPEYGAKLDAALAPMTQNQPIPAGIDMNAIKDHTRVDPEGGTFRPEFLPDLNPQIGKIAGIQILEVQNMISSDSSLGYGQKQELLEQLQQAQSWGLSMTPQQLVGAGLGGLAGWLASRLAGFGAVGQVMGGLAGGLFGSALAAPPSSEQIYGSGFYRA